VLLVIAVALQLLVMKGFFSFLPFDGTYAPIIICIACGYIVARFLHAKEVE
jgi:hypothetical protein